MKYWTCLWKTVFCSYMAIRNLTEKNIWSLSWTQIPNMKGWISAYLSIYWKVYVWSKPGQRISDSFDLHHEGFFPTRLWLRPCLPANHDITRAADAQAALCRELLLEKMPEYTKKLWLSRQFHVACDLPVHDQQLLLPLAR